MIVVIGKSGQLAQELANLCTEKKATFLGRNDINLRDHESVTRCLDALAPSAIINASAYTAVDKAETEREDAFALNGMAVKHLAKYSAAKDCFLVQVSSDYVFDGMHFKPYQTDHPISPQSVYGRSKAEGEKHVLEHHADKSAILRTSWVYSEYGNNFVKTMLRLMAEKPELGVVCDQIGSPTWGKGLAEMCLAVVQQKLVGVYHYCDAGVASWYDFAVAIQQFALENGMLQQKIPIKPITTEQYPTPASRPHFSVLSSADLHAQINNSAPIHWQAQLQKCLLKLADKQNV